MNIPVESVDCVVPQNGYSAVEFLLAESDAILSLAEDQNNREFKYDAQHNFHAACIFVRVITSMMSILGQNSGDTVQQRLMYASWRVRQLCSTRVNFIVEHFYGGACSDVYRLNDTKRLGKGSYGSVYLGTHSISGVERAVKVMNVDSPSAYYLRKIHIEISILKTIDHPNIISLKEVFFGRKSVYLITSLCRGGELFELLNSGKEKGFVFKEERAAELMADMFSSVHYLHLNGIIHRDLKLENFLFLDDSAHSPLVLIDFGLSKKFDHGEKFTQRVGSCYYTAPELLLGSYDYRCDIWSLGVLCYMILSGSPPFYGPKLDDVYDATMRQEPTFPEKKFGHLSPACIDFMKRLLVKDPATRMTTEEALVHPFITRRNLGGLLVPQTVVAGPDGVGVSESSVIAFVDHTVPTRPSLTVVQVEVAISSLKSYIETTPLIRLIYDVMVTLVSEEVKAPYREEFLLIDTKRIGMVSLADFWNVLNIAPSSQMGSVDLYQIYDELAVSYLHGHSRDLTYSEYLSAAMCDRFAVNDVLVGVVFNFLDSESTGILTTSSLRKRLGDDTTKKGFEDIIRDGGGDAGSVSRIAFFECWHAHLIKRQASKGLFVAHPHAKRGGHGGVNGNGHVGIFAKMNEKQAMQQVTSDYRHRSSSSFNNTTDGETETDDTGDMDCD